MDIKREYYRLAKATNPIIEVIDPLGGVAIVMVVNNFSVESVNSELNITGYNVTDFFKENRFLATDEASYLANVMGMIQKLSVTQAKFSKHFWYSVYSINSV